MPQLQSSEADREKILGLLKEKNQAVSPSQITHLIGMGHYEAETALQDLMAILPCRLEANEKGELVYHFRLTAIPLPKKSWDYYPKLLLSFLFKLWIIVVMYSFGLFYGGLLVLIVSLFGAPLVAVYFLVGLVTGLYELVVGMFNYLTGKTVKQNNTNPLQVAFAFAFGQPSADPKPLVEQRILDYLRQNDYKITNTELVMLTGWELETARERATELLSNYKGLPKVTENGIIIYEFDEIRLIAEDAKKLEEEQKTKQLLNMIWKDKFRIKHNRIRDFMAWDDQQIATFIKEQKAKVAKKDKNQKAVIYEFPKLEKEKGDQKHEALPKTPFIWHNPLPRPKWNNLDEGTNYLILLVMMIGTVMSAVYSIYADPASPDFWRFSFWSFTPVYEDVFFISFWSSYFPLAFSLIYFTLAWLGERKTIRSRIPIDQKQLQNHFLQLLFSKLPNFSEKGLTSKEKSIMETLRVGLSGEPHIDEEGNHYNSFPQLTTELKERQHLDALASHRLGEGYKPIKDKMLLKAEEEAKELTSNAQIFGFVLVAAFLVTWALAAILMSE